MSRDAIEKVVWSCHGGVVASARARVVGIRVTMPSLLSQPGIEAKSSDGVGHVMHGFKRSHQVVLARASGVCRAAHLEGHSLSQT